MVGNGNLQNFSVEILVHFISQQRTQSVSTRRTNCSILFTEIIAIFCESKAKHQFVVDKALRRFSSHYESTRTLYSFVHSFSYSFIQISSTLYILKNCSVVKTQRERERDKGIHSVNTKHFLSFTASCTYS
jgi:hypothetical protein